MKQLRIVNQRNDFCLGDKINLADSFVKRALGLLPRSGLAPGEGIFIKPCNSIHMLGMRFSIDALFINQNLEVLKISENLKPWFSVSLCFPAASVIELPCGTIAQADLLLNDQLNIFIDSEKVNFSDI